MAAKPKDRRRPRPPAAPTKAVEALDADHQHFILEYLSNGENATAAYLVVKPHVTRKTAAVEGWKLLRKPAIAAALERELRARWKRIKMDGDEALALISRDARADIAEAYDAAGNLLPVRMWPKRLRLSVRSIRPGKDGDQVTLNDSLKARELMAIAAGKLRTNVNVNVFDLAKYLGDEPPNEEE